MRIRHVNHYTAGEPTVEAGEIAQLFYAVFLECSRPRFKPLLVTGANLTVNRCHQEETSDCGTQLYNYLLFIIKCKLNL